MNNTNEKTKASSIAFADELKTIIDRVSALVDECVKDGYVPTFSVKAGILGMVAVYHPSATVKGKRGRPRKTPEALLETAMGEDR